MSIKNKNLDLIKEIPNVSKYEHEKVNKKNNWFNKNLSFLLLVLFVLLGILIVLVIAL